MQNKINQKVPIAKMDELIAAIKESGGGGSKWYRHKVTIFLKKNGSTSGTLYFSFISTSDVNVTNLNFDDIIGVFNGSSTGGTPNIVYTNKTGDNYMVFDYKGSNLDTFTSLSINDAVTEL